MQQRSQQLRRQNSERPQGKIAREDIGESLGKLPPQAPELETAVLGALMLESGALNEVIEFLKADHFYLEKHKIIYEAIIELYTESAPIDMNTVMQRLRRMGKLELCEGAYYIAELTSKVSSAANIQYHARIILEMAIKRNLIEIATVAHTKGYDDTIDAFEMMEAMQISLDTISGNAFKGNFELVGNIYVEQMKVIDERMTKKGVIGIPSGLRAVDVVTNGFMNHELTIIASRPGMGKTATVVSIMLEISIVMGIPTAIFSLEMAKAELMDRMISQKAEIELGYLRSGKLSDIDNRKRKENTLELNEAPIWIDDNPNLTPLELRARARRLVMKHGVKIIFIDYLQLMHEDGHWSREQEISSISRSCKVLAKELGIPVVALSQLSRGVEQRRGDMRPKLSDLRESGSIEQDADVVMFLFRPEYYKVTKYEDGSPTAGVMEIIISKHRNGAVGTAQVEYIGKYTKVQNLATDLIAARELPALNFSESTANEDPDALPF